MDTTHFQSISDAELEQVTGAFGLDFFGPFPVVGFKTPEDSAYATGLINQLIGTFTGVGGPLGDFAVGVLNVAKTLVPVKFS